MANIRASKVFTLLRMRAFILLITVMLISYVSFLPALSQFTKSVSITSTGQISLPIVYALSGSATDIQAAVDQLVASTGIGSVFIPAGTFNFSEDGEPWVTVNIPAGVNIFGEPTERDSNGQVIAWKTVLVLPWDVPSNWDNILNWFSIQGDGDPIESSQFSDIKLVGYRSINPNSTAIHRALNIVDVVDFRVDHCYFEHIVGGGLRIWGSRGVVDHSFFVNQYGHVEANSYACTVGYGVSLNRAYGDVWEDNTSMVLGQYTDYTTFIEDCYFEKWRHAVAANRGGHYVFRYNTIKDDFGFGSVDSHGSAWWDGSQATQVGTRATEIYENNITDAFQNPWVTMIRGGSGVAFNNTVGNGTYSYFIYFSNEADPELSKCWVHDWWIWNNTLLSGCTEIINSPAIVEGVDFFRYPPHTFNYQPYIYPHPLTQNVTP